MSATTRLVAFGALLAVLFTAAAAAGGALDPDARGEESAEPMAGDAHGGDAEVHGLAVADDAGLQLDVVTPELRRGREQRPRLPRARRATARAVRDFDVEHERAHAPDRRPARPHRLPAPAPGAARRRRLGRPGSRSPTPAPTACSPTSRTTARRTTLAADLRVDGAADLRALPAPATVADAGDGYQVRLAAGAVRAGEEAELRFAVTRDGEPVATEPYLGAGGHLVALREGDLAFLHVHPTTTRLALHGRRSRAPGRYRLFLQFRHEGAVHTAAFTQEVAR